MSAEPRVSQGNRRRSSGSAAGSRSSRSVPSGCTSKGRALASSARRRPSRASTTPTSAGSSRSAIAVIATSDVYEGLPPLKRQRGLIPIGENPKTGLWEFYHLRSGAEGHPIPKHDADGRLEITGATGMVFVLLLGGMFWQGAQRCVRMRRITCGSQRNVIGSSRTPSVPFFHGLRKLHAIEGEWGSTHACTAACSEKPSRSAQSFFRTW